jgi:hypothetical protein
VAMSAPVCVIWPALHPCTAPELRESGLTCDLAKMWLGHDRRSCVSESFI